jgi:hypothetical protein
MIRYPRIWAVVAVVVLLAASFTLSLAKSKEQKQLLKFAARMAKDGNWGEARYRWQSAAAVDPGNPFILNNIAVALEAEGEHDEAKEYYTKALTLSDGNEWIEDNVLRLAHLLDTLDADAGDGAPELEAAIRQNSSKKPRKGPDPTQVQILVPLPPKLDLTGIEKILVASFLTDESESLDINREVVRFLRGEFRQETSLDVLDVTPPPAVPEQRLEDLIANHEFWKHLGRQHGADIIVSGKIDFDRNDISGFQNFDTISSVTGQKVRGTQFVEQEEFEYVMTVLFIDGKSGELLYRDEVRRTIKYQGLMNDSLAAFFDMSEMISGDVLSVVSSRKRLEERTIFAG